MKALLLAAAALACAFGQSAAPPQFDAASVKPNPSLALRHVILPPVGGHLSTRNASLSLLIQTAYAVPSFQISGGPDWMNSAGFDVDAKAEGNPSRSQVWLMLQSLLEDRFKLQIHRETKELPVYALTTAKSGLKMPAASEGDCTNLGTLPSPDGKAEHPLTGPCGDLMVGAYQPGMFLRGRQVPVAEFTRVLSGILGRPVIDKTGLAGKFDLNLDFSYDDLTVGIPKPAQSADNINPSILVAMQQQLGLKLESTRGPVEILVIDHAERPSGN